MQIKVLLIWPLGCLSHSPLCFGCWALLYALQVGVSSVCKAAVYPFSCPLMLHVFCFSYNKHSSSALRMSAKADIRVSLGIVWPGVRVDGLNGWIPPGVTEVFVFRPSTWSVPLLHGLCQHLLLADMLVDPIWWLCKYFSWRVYFVFPLQYLTTFFVYSLKKKFLREDVPIHIFCLFFFLFLCFHLISLYSVSSLTKSRHWPLVVYAVNIFSQFLAPFPYICIELCRSCPF